MKNDFEMIRIEHLQRKLLWRKLLLPKKKSTEEEITSDILKVAFHVIKKQFVDNK